MRRSIAIAYAPEEDCRQSKEDRRSVVGMCFVVFSYIFVVVRMGGGGGRS